MAYKVFVSSTYEDLIDHRATVSLHLRKAGYHTLEMETMAARNEKPLEVCMQEVAEADLFVGIYAWRYGFVPAGWEESITELELNEAQWLYKPIFCFLVDPKLDSPVPREEEEKARKLEELKQRIRTNTTLDKASFRTPEELALSVLAALSRWKDREIPANLSRERIQQLDLGKKVERIWVENVLRRKVHAGRELHISRETRPKEVGQQPSEESLPDGRAGRAVEPLYSFFRRQGRSLLILGPQGAGKTVALIELVRGLVPLAIRNTNAPIPVLFNLASWKWQDLTPREWQNLTPRERQKRSLAAWMAGELLKYYQAGKKEPAKWIKDHWILPLLDGLDEVGEGCRQSCVEAINAHLEEHGFAGMAVACRTPVYQKLPKLWRLWNAVALLPLSPAQIEKHLLTASPPLDRLRAAIQGDAGLRELVSSPLMLTIIEKGAQHTGPEDPLTGQGPDRVGQAYEDYITHALKPERERERDVPWPSETGERPLTLRERWYPPEKARRILAWLAHGMVEHSLALFQIERLQPSWLTTRGQIFTYSVLSHVLGGTLLTLPLAVVFSRMDFVAAGLAAGTLIGTLEIPRLLRKEPPESRGAAASLGRAFARTLFLGGFACAFLLLIALYGLRLTRDPDQTLSNALLESILLVGAVCGGVFGSRGAMRTGSSDIRVAEALVWKGWSRKWALFGAVSLLLGSLTCWAIADLFSRAGIQDHSNGADFWLPFSLIVAVLGGALSGAFGGLGGKTLGKDAPPNWGTWLSLRNAGVAGLVTGLAATLVLAFVLGSLEVAGSVMPQGTLPWFPLQVGAVLGFWAGLAYSGLDFVQHFSLRLVLRLWRLVPGRLVDFLEYAVERELLDRPGGSYQFIHSELRDWFKRQPRDQSLKTSAAES